MCSNPGLSVGRAFALLALRSAMFTTKPPRTHSIATPAPASRRVIRIRLDIIALAVAFFALALWLSEPVRQYRHELMLRRVEDVTRLLGAEAGLRYFNSQL